MWSAFDVLFGLLSAVSLIRIGPKLWMALYVNGVRHATQTGCKMLVFTDFGLRHVAAALVVGVVAVAFAKVVWKMGDELDAMVKIFTAKI